MFKLPLLPTVGVLLFLVACGSDNTPNSSSSSSSSSSSTSSSSGLTVFPSSVSRPKVMIVGDSISAGAGCYKKYLDQNLKDNGISNYDFVGEYSDDCGGGVMHSAVSCTTTSDYLKDSFSLPNCPPVKTFKGLSQLMLSHNPDLVLMQLGVNDIWGGSTPVQNVLGNYTKLIAQMRAHNPKVVVVTAQIHKVITDNCTNQNAYQNAKNLIEAVPAWAAGVSTTGSPVFVADLWTNSDPNDANDCVHPDEVGAQKMGANWYEALKDILW